MPSLRQTVLIVAALNLGYFGVEFFAALKAGSVSSSPTAPTSWKTPRSTS